MYEALADYYQEQGYFTNSPARAYRYQILLEFAAMKDPANREIYRELLTYDMYLRENLKSRPAFAAEITEEENRISAVFTRRKSRRDIIFLPMISMTGNS